jgi:hypothetical protein
MTYQQRIIVRNASATETTTGTPGIYPVADYKKALEEMERKHLIPKGFGPDHPRWDVPSFRNKYLRAIGEL